MKLGEEMVFLWCFCLQTTRKKNSLSKYVCKTGRKRRSEYMEGVAASRIASPASPLLPVNGCAQPSRNELIGEGSFLASHEAECSEILRKYFC